MCIPSQITCNCYSKVFNAFDVFKVSSLQGIWRMNLLDPFSCQLHHIAFDRLKSHTPIPCPGTQSINIPLKFHCVFFILNFTIVNTVISKKVLFQTQYLMRCHLCTKRISRDQERCPGGHPTKPEPSQILLHLLLSEAKKRIYPFQCLATDSIAKRLFSPQGIDITLNMSNFQPIKSPINRLPHKKIEISHDRSFIFTSHDNIDQWKHS